MVRLRKIRAVPSYITAFFICGIVFLTIIVVRNAGYFEYIELLTYDWLIRRQPGNSKLSKEIVIIGINEEDLQNHGRWPLSDEIITKALDSLLLYRPRAIGLDIFRDLPVTPGSDDFNKTLEQNKNIIAVMKFGDDGVSAPKSVQEKERIGFNDILVDQGGVVRRGLLYLDDGESFYESFALQLALQYLSFDGIFTKPDQLNPEHLSLGDTTIPPIDGNTGGYIDADARGYQFLLDFKAQPQNFQVYSLEDVLSKNIPKEKIQDRIVIIGLTTNSVKDFFYTPLSRGIRIRQQIPGVIVHSQITDQLLRLALGESNPIKSLNDIQEIQWILICCLFGGAVAFFVRSPLRFSIIGITSLTCMVLFAYFSFSNFLWIPVVAPALSWIISSALITTYISSREKYQRLFLMQLFSRHVSKEIADSIWQKRNEFLNNGRPQSQKAIVTVMFSDLKGFTNRSEKMDPNTLVEWLNMYMEAMAQVINGHGGVIDDYAGDGIKVNFGVPIPRNTRDEIGHDAINAVDCALAMKKRMKELNETWLQQNLPATGTRIGIYTGPVVAGALGSSDRLKYTTIGDTVNIAARLESYDKNFEKESICRILIGDSTLRYIGDVFKTVFVGEEILRGKDISITIHLVQSRNK